MLDIQYIRDHPEEVKQATANKGANPKAVDEVLRLDTKRRELIQQTENIRAERNQLNDELKAKREAGLIIRSKELKQKLQDLEPELRQIEAAFEDLLRQVPNPPQADVHVGKNDTENKVIRTWGKPTKFAFTPKHHLDLGEELDLIDVKRAAKISGSRFTYLKNDAVLLEFALIQFAMSTLIKKGFTPMIPPVLLKKDVTKKLGYWENQGHEDYFVINEPTTTEGESADYYLVGTAEHAIVPYYQNEILSEKDLPKRFVGFSTAFRREAGSYGKDTKGILRVHQFDKVEMVSLTTPEESDKEHQFLLAIEEELFQALEIPYQVVAICTGDLGHPAARKYDIEAWIPSENKYREVTSASTTTDYQSRRLNIKYRHGDHTDFVHMLNGTAYAIGRTILAILENHQQKDGSIKIPKVLQGYMGKSVIKG